MKKNIFRLLFVVSFLFILLGVNQAVRIYRFGKKIDYDMQPWQHFNPSAEFRVLFAGDSTAVGTGATDNTMSTAGWFSKDFPEAYVENHSRNGLRLAGLIEILNQLQGKKFDLAVLQIGANDVMRFTNFTDITNSLNEVLHLTRQIAPEMIILHSGNIGDVGMFHWPLSWIYTQRSLKMREIYLRASEDADVSYVDIYLLDKKVENMNENYSADQLHLNNHGYYLWYTYIRDKIKLKAPK